MDVCIALDLEDPPATLAAWARLGTTRHVISYERGTSEQLLHLQCALEMKNLIFAAVLTRDGESHGVGQGILQHCCHVQGNEIHRPA